MRIRTENRVVISGTLVSRQDELTKRRVPRIVLEIYNPNVRDVFRAVIYGYRRVENLGPSIRMGALIRLSGQLTNVRWRTSEGQTVREIGVDVRKVHILSAAAQSTPPSERPEVQANSQHISELRRLGEQLGLDRDALRDYLGCEPEELNPGRLSCILQKMAEEVQKMSQQLRRGGQLDCLTTASSPTGSSGHHDQPGGNGVGSERGS